MTIILKRLGDIMPVYMHWL